MLFAPTAHVTSLTQVKQQLAPSLLSACCIDHDKTTAKSGKHKQKSLKDVKHFKVEHNDEHLSGRTEHSMKALRKLESELLAYLECRTRVEQHKTLQQYVDGKAKAHEEKQIDRGELFKRMSGIKVHMDAINLTAAGIKNMSLMQRALRPIFTVECRLSNELICQVPRYDMFNIMQFECEKFQRSKQCARFGQASMRQVRLPMNFLDKTTQEPNLGCLHFTVWWRERGTCFNEMLGLGSLKLAELYKCSTLEQYFCMGISRRGLHLANMHMKISLFTDLKQTFEHISQQKQEAGIRKAADDTASKPVSQQQSNNNSDNQQRVTNFNSIPLASDSAMHNNNSFSPINTNNSRNSSQVCLLKGFIYVSEARHLNKTAENTKYKYYLKCQCFWQDKVDTKTAIAENAGAHNFHYLEEFAVINDKKFLSRVECQHWQLEIYRSNNVDTNNKLPDDNLELVGVLQLPLHQFFIAYHDEAIINHLYKRQMPVNSVDGWVPIKKFKTEEASPTGEVKCLLAVGSEEQIANLRESRGLGSSIPKGVSCKATSNQNSSTSITTFASASASETSTSARVQQRLTDKNIRHEQNDNKLNNNIAIKNANSNLFTVALCIRNAIQLPMQSIVRQRKKRNGNTSRAERRTEQETMPSTYVTFQAVSLTASTNRTNQLQETDIFTTKIIEKSTEPQWLERFVVNLQLDYLNNKKFVLKIWHKNNSERGTTGATNKVTPLQDHLIGTASFNLNALLFGKQIDECLKVLDLNDCLSGYIYIKCNLLESLLEVQQRLQTKYGRSASVASASAATDSIDKLLNDMVHLNLGHALKRKMLELEQISERLRVRLTDVTGEDLSNAHFDAIEEIKNEELSNIDAEVAQFEHDINTECTDSQSSNIQFLNKNK